MTTQPADDHASDDRAADASAAGGLAAGDVPAVEATSAELAAGEASAGDRASAQREADDLAAPPRVEGEAISGRVTDFEAMPLVGVRVEAAVSGGADLDQLPVLTDGEGHFRLEGLAEGRYDLRFALGTVRARTLAVPVGTDQLRVRLARPQGILLLVQTPEGTTPPDLVHVVLHRHVDDRLMREYVGRHLTTRLLLWSIRPGTYTVTVWGGPWVPVEARGVRIREGEPAPEVQILLAVEGATIQGRVALPAPAPPTRAPARGGEQGAAEEDDDEVMVCWRRLDGANPWPRVEQASWSEEDGRFVVRGLPAGRYLVAAGRETGPIVEREVELTEGQTADVVL